MKTLAASMLLLLLALPAMPQGAFTFDSNASREVIPFQLINNLIFIPVEVNGVELTFLLDSGIGETLLFSFDDTDEITFENVQKIRLRGLGSAEDVECYKSIHNKLRIGSMKAVAQDIYIVLDQDLNISANIGIPVNGIIGYHFFQNNLIEINYEKRKLIVYNNRKAIAKKLTERYTMLPISIEFQKPYVHAEVQQNESEFSAKLLIDTGSSDSVWLFSGVSNNVKMPKKTVEDYLGRGFSGDIHGKRGRIEQFKLDKYSFERPIAAFPDSVSLAKIKLVDGRVGSVGGEILRRFNVVFDYQNKKVYLKKSGSYDEPFLYNMSGIELHHDGVQWIQESVEPNQATVVSTYDGDGNKKKDLQFKFELKPIYCISSVRANSPAELSGLKKGDIVTAINHTKAFRYSLQEISQLLKSEDGKTIEIEVERNSKPLKFTFTLQSLL